MNGTPWRVIRYLLSVTLWMVTLPAASLLWAHGDEDHSQPAGTAKEATQTILPGIPKFETASEQIELVGVYDQGVLTLYVDDFSTNASLAGLSIEISADQNSVMAVERAPGEYQAKLPWVTQFGHYPLTFLLQGETVTDLQQATLDTRVAAPAAAATPSVWPRWYWGAGGGLGLLLVWGVTTLGMRKRRVNVLPIVMIAGLLVMPQAKLWAHGGEEHAHADAATPIFSGSAPHRLPDGRVFIPKATQHLLKLRTLLAKEESGHRSVSLNGRVIADPGASGVVQAGQAGKIEIGPQGFPVLGQQVKAGQVLAYLRPLTTSLELGNQQASLAEMDSQLTLAERKRERLQSLVGSVPQKDIEAAQLDVEGLRKRRDAVARSLYQKEPLMAPVAGVISTSEAVVGQVVSEGTLLFTVVQPDRLWVEALSYDSALVLGEDTAVAQAGAIAAKLRRVGSGAALRDQSIPLHFRIEAPVPAVPVGQPVTVLVKTQAVVQGIPVPIDALARNAEGQWVVWLHEKAEVFRPVAVQSEALDGERVMITQGLAPGARVVSAGAASLGQIR